MPARVIRGVAKFPADNREPEDGEDDAGHHANKRTQENSYTDSRDNERHAQCKQLCQPNPASHCGRLGSQDHRSHMCRSPERRDWRLSLQPGPVAATSQYWGRSCGVRETRFDLTDGALVRACGKRA